MIACIVAMDNNGGIGKNGKMPWHIKEDLQYFKEITKNSTIIMGRKTFESIGFALPQRNNIVISSQLLNAENITMATSFEDAYEKALKNNEDVFIIGGQSLYQHFVLLSDVLYITHVETEVEGCDAYFPIDLLYNFKKTHSFSRKNKNAFFNYNFDIYEPNNKII